MKTRARDRYCSFNELASREKEGEDFRITVARRSHNVMVLAPHGGAIEPTTSEIAAAIAGDTYSLYCFEGLRQRDHNELHITSTNFDEPRCLQLLAEHDLAIAVHGYANSELPEHIFLGGRDISMRQMIEHQLAESGFPARADLTVFRGLSAHNICNRSKRGMGVQLEISRQLRDQLRQDSFAMRRFSVAVRLAIDAFVRRT